MALEFMDGCSHLGTGSHFPPAIPADRKWTSTSPLGVIYVNGSSSPSGPVRRTNPAFAAPACSMYMNSSFPTKTLLYVTERFMGAAYYLASSNPQIKQFFFMGSGGVNLAWLTVESDQTVSIYAFGNATPIFNSSPFTFTLDAFHYVQFSVTLGGGAPITVTASLTIDGHALAVGATGNTTVNASSLLVQAAEMNQIGFSGGAAFLMDVFVMNTDTTDVNGEPTTLTGFQGDLALMDLVPDANVTTGWALVGGATQYGVLANIPPQDDVEYITSSTVTQASTVNMTPITGLTGTIVGAQLCVYCKKDAEGSRAIRALLNGTDLANWTGVSSTPVNDQYLFDYYDDFLFPLDTLLGTAWTPANFNSAAFGLRVSI
jgi:hypothetical protein